MNKKLRGFLDSEKFLIPISVLVAIVIWVFVVLFVNGDAVRIINNVPITFQTINPAEGLSVISEDAQSVNIVIQGKRSEIGILTAADFVVTADYSQIHESGLHKIDLSVAKVSAAVNVSVLSFSPSVVNVTLDRIITKKLPVEVELTRATVAEGFVLQPAVSSRSEISISGPEDEVVKIAKCVAKWDINTVLNESASKKVSVEFRGEDGNVIKPNFITTDLTETEITVTVLKEKVVELVFDYIGAPSSLDTSQLNWHLSSRTLRIAGPAAAIDKMTTLNLGFVDIKKLKLDGQVTMEVNLPTGFVNLDEEHTEIIVYFDFTSYLQKMFTVTGLRLTNVPAEYDVSIVTKSIRNVYVIGESSALGAMTASSVIAEIDLSGIGDLTVGQQTVPVSMIVESSGIAFAVGDYTAVITITRKQ